MPQRDSVTVGSIPDDYRTNHPIVIAEKEQAHRPAGRRRRARHDHDRSAIALDGFLADYDRSAAPVLTIHVADRVGQRRGGSRRRRATSPQSQRAAASRRAASSSTSYQAGRRRGLGAGPRHLHRDAGPDRQVRSLAGGHRSTPARTSTTRISAAPIRTTSPPRSPIRPICSDRASRRRSMPRTAAA